jgi:hypothetical protein
MEVLVGRPERPASDRGDLLKLLTWFRGGDLGQARGGITHDIVLLIFCQRPMWNVLQTQVWELWAYYVPHAIAYSY